jgi:hypothetical protein
MSPPPRRSLLWLVAGASGLGGMLPGALSTLLVLKLGPDKETHAGQGSSRRRRLMFGVWVAAALLGGAFGVWFVDSSTYRNAPLWPVWAPQVVASTTAAGLVFGYGLSQWTELTRFHRLRVRPVVNRI